MVHSGGFEPPTARFVAEYSIQLSYECIFIFKLLSLKLSISAVSRGAYISDLRVKRQVEFAIISKFYYLL
jgi:hypothetical protein